jgi:ectoine hydroxylase-related dioxygenase (phytanoyl-CoA dioxygenase family)
MLDDFKKKMNFTGWYKFPNFIGSNLIEDLLIDLEKSYENCRKIQIENGVENSEGTCHHLIGQGDSFLKCLSAYESINSELEKYFQGKYILNSFGGNILKRGMSYANGIHRDIRTFSGSIPLMLNTLIMLDDFTEDNGATWLMNMGHEWDNKPTESEFDKYKFQITGKAGTLVIWNSNMWHKAGENKTDNARRSITPEFTKPFMKQGFDYSRVVSKSDSPYLQQVLGLNSLVPSSLNDWYQPREHRLYKDDQG